MIDPLQIQVAGQHYKDCAIQPIEYIQANNLGFEEGCILKYLTRHQAKCGRQDIEKIKPDIRRRVAGKTSRKSNITAIY